MAMGKKRQSQQEEMWIDTRCLPKAPGHYMRVSTADQCVDSQRQELLKFIDPLWIVIRGSAPPMGPHINRTAGKVVSGLALAHYLKVLPVETSK